jgi:hypothetical protein
MAGREKWSCEMCKADRFRKLQEDLQNALRQIDKLKARNRDLKDKLLLVGAAKRDTVPAKQKSAKCMVVGDSVVSSVGDEHTDMIVECFPGIKTEQLYKVIDNRDIGSPETVIIQVGTNDPRTTNLDLVMGEVYTLVTTTKVKHPNCRLALSGLLRHSDVSWRRIGALNDRFDWIAGVLGITFVDPNSWTEDGDFARDGLHRNGRGNKQLGHLYARV